MTRAEIASLEAYPLRFDLPDDLLRRMLHGGERKHFQEGYERAEKDTIEMAIAWLEKHANDYIVDLTPTYPDAPSQVIIGGIQARRQGSHHHCKGGRAMKEAVNFLTQVFYGSVKDVAAIIIAEADGDKATIEKYLLTVHNYAARLINKLNKEEQ